MLKIFLDLLKSEPQYAYKRDAYKKHVYEHGNINVIFNKAGTDIFWSVNVIKSDSRIFYSLHCKFMNLVTNFNVATIDYIFTSL